MPLLCLSIWEVSRTRPSTIQLIHLAAIMHLERLRIAMRLVLLSKVTLLESSHLYLHQLSQQNTLSNKLRSPSRSKLNWKRLWMLWKKRKLKKVAKLKARSICHCRFDQNCHQVAPKTRECAIFRCKCRSLNAWIRSCKRCSWQDLVIWTLKHTSKSWCRGSEDTNRRSVSDFKKWDSQILTSTWAETPLVDTMPKALALEKVWVFLVSILQQMWEVVSRKTRDLKQWWRMCLGSPCRLQMPSFSKNPGKTKRWKTQSTEESKTSSTLFLQTWQEGQRMQIKYCRQQIMLLVLDL